MPRTKPTHWIVEFTVLGPRVRVIIPRKFWDDHFERCCDHPGERIEIKLGAKLATVELDYEALANLKSDADFYADPVGFEPEVMPLCRSALATVKALKKQGW